MNLAQGEFALLGAFFAIAAVAAGVPLVPAVALTVVGMALLAGQVSLGQAGCSRSAATRWPMQRP